MIADTRVGDDAGAPRQRLALLSLLAACYTYALVVFGGIVRITGSGLGCGNDWPRCHGEWIPPFTLNTLIEYTHRLLAAGIGIVVLAVFGYALLHRRAPAVSGRGGMLRPLVLATTLFVLQALLGAVTVWLDLPPAVTIVHFVTALVFMATLINAAARGGALGESHTAGSTGNVRRAASWATAAAAVGLVVVAFGAATANTPGAAAACTGFPLCSGWLIPPAQATTAHVQWGHRLVAFALVFVIVAAVLVTRGGASPRARRMAVLALALVFVQLGVAAALVLLRLPHALQALHLAVGAAVWFALAAWATLARLDTRTSAVA